MARKNPKTEQVRGSQMYEKKAITLHLNCVCEEDCDAARGKTTREKTYMKRPLPLQALL